MHVPASEADPSQVALQGDRELETLALDGLLPDGLRVAELAVAPEIGIVGAVVSVALNRHQRDRDDDAHHDAFAEIAPAFFLVAGPKEKPGAEQKREPYRR